MDAIRFTTGGIKPDEIRRSEFLALMEGYAQKSFIPIVNFPAQANSDEKDAILSVVEDIIIRQVGIERNVATGIKYMKDRNLDSFYSLPEGIRWNGTIVAFRIPFQSPEFNYINYIDL